MENFRTYLGIYNYNMAKYGAVLEALREIIFFRERIKPCFNCYDMLEQIGLNDASYKKYNNTQEMTHDLINKAFNQEVKLLGKVDDNLKKDSDIAAKYIVTPQEIELAKKIIKNIILAAINRTREDKNLLQKHLNQAFRDDLTVEIALKFSDISSIYFENDVIGVLNHFSLSLINIFNYYEMDSYFLMQYNGIKQSVVINIDWL